MNNVYKWGMHAEGGLENWFLDKGFDHYYVIAVVVNM